MVIPCKGVRGKEDPRIDVGVRLSSHAVSVAHICSCQITSSFSDHRYYHPVLKSSLEL